MTVLPFSCRCGRVTGTLADVGKFGSHLVCRCRYCRSAHILFGGTDPEPDGVHVWQTTPDKLHIATGRDQLRSLAMSTGDYLRWHTHCCTTQICTTFRDPKQPIAGVQMALFDCGKDFGPVDNHTFVPTARGRRHDSLVRLYASAGWRMVVTRVTGRWRDTPFFGDDGQPVSAPRKLTQQERAGLPL